MEMRLLGGVPKHGLHRKRHSSIRVGAYNLWRHKGFKRLMAAPQLESVNHDTSRNLGFTHRSCRAHGFGRRYSGDNALSKDRSCFGDRSPGMTSVIYAG
jgi:hypothetical protein